MIEAKQEAPSNPQVTWAIWGMWVLAGGLATALQAVPWFFLSIQTVDPVFRDFVNIPNFVILSAFVLAAPTYLQAIIVRKIFPRADPLVWFLVMLAVLCIWTTFQLTFDQWAGQSLEREFRRQALELKYNDRTLFDYVALPWWKPLLPQTALALLVSFPIAIYLGLFVKGKFLKLWLVFAAGTLCASFVQFIYSSDAILRMNWVDMWSAQNASAPRVLYNFWLRSNCGMVGAAVTGAGLAVLLNTRAKFSLRITPSMQAHWAGGPILAAIIAFSGYAYYYAASVNGWKNGFPEFRRALSFAPNSETSEGRNILTFSHYADIISKSGDTSGSATLNAFSPDGQMFTAYDGDRTLSIINVSNGTTLSKVGERRRKYERTSHMWAPKQDLFLYRTEGAEKTIVGRTSHPHTSLQSRIRSYTVPDFGLKGEFEAEEEECANAIRNSLVEAGDNSVWVFCRQHYHPIEADVSLLKLSLPELNVLEKRTYGTSARFGPFKGALRSSSGLWVWHELSREGFRIENLNEPRQAFVIGPNSTRNASLAGKLHFRSVHISSDEPHLAIVRFCGSIEDPAKQMKKQTEVVRTSETCRELHLNLIDGDYTTLPSQQSYAFRGWFLKSDQNYSFRSNWSRASKKSSLEVLDRSNQVILQTITSRKQIPAAVSPDGQWLVTNEADTGRVKVYRIASP